MKVIDLFAGCGGFSQGFQQTGYDIVGFVENWDPAIATFQKNKPATQLIGKDITKIPKKTFKRYKNKIDLIIGGPPCQGFSHCGKRNPKDKRNKLYKEFLKAVKLVEPKYVVMENVQGLLSMKGVIDDILNQLMKLGYFVSYKVLNASDYQVAQERKRLIIIGKKLDLFPEPCSEKKTVIEAIEGCRGNAHVQFNPKKETLERISKLAEGEKLCSKYNFSRQRLFANKPSKTVVTKNIYIHPYEDRFLTPRELARLQSFPDDFYFCGNKTSMVTQIGNAVPVLMAKAIAEKIKEDCEK